MKILKLALKNFKGIKSFVLDTQGGNVDVFGDNAAGKTTLFDAFMWLLFDKDSQNRKDFQIKTLNENGQPIHGLEHEVEAVLDITPPNDPHIISGKQITLRKVFYEKWQKKRGSAEKVFTGHTTDYYINGVPVKKAEYEAKIAELCDEAIFKLLTNPLYFNEQLHWQKRREILLQVCGDISDEDVIASDKSLAQLPEILQGRRLEDHRKVIAARRAEINRELEKIPVRIDEVQRSLPRVEDVDPQALADDIAKLRAERQAMVEERIRIQSGGQVAELQRRLAEVQAELVTARRRAQDAAEQAMRAVRQRFAELEDRIATKRRELERMEREQAEDRALIDRLERDIEAKRKQWYEVNSQTYSGPSLEEYLAANETQGTCPACGQPLPEDHIREAWERARAAYEEQVARFNATKAGLLERISEEGKALRKRADELQLACERRDADIRRVRDEIESLQEQATETGRELEHAQATAPDPANDHEVMRLQIEADRIADEIAELRAGNAEALSRVDAEIERINIAIQALEQEAARVEARRHGLARIEELKAQERRLAAEYERLEEELYLTEQFIRTKVQLLEKKINSRFKLARFKLFDVQVNGAVVECCETTYQGVPYSALNHGAQINVGLDIINTLAEHYGFAPPVFIDNAEAVTNLLPTRGQMIRLVVSGMDKTLRVEIAQKEAILKEAV
jgi:DNA repair exonuclease SbcCD ATPase subunit